MSECVERLLSDCSPVEGALIWGLSALRQRALGLLFSGAEHARAHLDECGGLSPQACEASAASAFKSAWLCESNSRAERLTSRVGGLGRGMRFGQCSPGALSLSLACRSSKRARMRGVALSMCTAAF